MFAFHDTDPRVSGVVTVDGVHTDSNGKNEHCYRVHNNNTGFTFQDTNNGSNNSE